MAAISQGFFRSSNPVLEAKHSNKQWADLGGLGDCGFRAIFAAILNNFETHSRLNIALINRLVSRYLAYFPEHQHLMPRLATPAERMKQLMKSVPMNQFIPAMAYTLRQIAVDEICSNPTRYPGAFVKQNERTAPAEMRKANTWVDESSIYALSTALDLPIEVKVVEQNKPLPMRLEYNIEKEDELTNPRVVIKLQSKHYTAQVTTGRFNQIELDSNQMPTPSIDNHRKQDPSLEEVLVLIKKEEKRVEALFHQVYNRLFIMVSDKKWDVNDLIKIYVAGIPSSDYLAGRARQLSLEQGNQYFYQVIEAARHGGQLPEMTDSPELVMELMHAIARAVSIGHMPDLFEPTQQLANARSCAMG